MADSTGAGKAPLFDIIPENFFSPLASPNRLVYWESICRLWQAMGAQLSFGIEREVLENIGCQVQVNGMLLAPVPLRFGMLNKGDKRWQI